MSEDVSYHLGLVCEGPADARTVQLLVERILTRDVEWMQDQFDDIVGWRGVENRSDYTTWSGSDGVKQLARSWDIRFHGRFSGLEGRGEALQALKALALFQRKSLQTSEEDSPSLTGVFLVRDTDDDRSRRDKLERARNEADWPFEVVLGLPHTKRECWILTAFAPRGDEEERLEELCSELGFDPTRDAHELTAESSGALRDAKRVLDRLTDGNTGREDEAFETSRIAELRVEGEEVGLTDFIEEVEERIADHFDNSGPG